MQDINRPASACWPKLQPEVMFNSDAVISIDAVPLIAPGGAWMGTVVIRCIVTGLEFSVGIETDEYSFHSLPDLRLKARCPHCGSDHDWSPRQARLRMNAALGISKRRREIIETTVEG